MRACTGRPRQNRVRHRVLAERQLGLMALANYLDGGRGAEGPGIASPAMGANRPPGQSRPAMTDPARRVIEARHRDGSLPDHAAERCEGLLARDRAGHDVAALWVQACGTREYEGAFAKWARDPARGHMLWSGEEQAAWASAQRIRGALSEGSGAGGELLPTILDPAVLLSSAGALDPLRRIARVETIAADKWRGVSSAGSSAEWKSEGSPVADASPSFDQPEVPVHLCDAFAPFSYELAMDAPGFMGELQRVLADAAAVLMAQGYWKGTGTGQPSGLAYTLAAGSKVPAANADTIVEADVVGLQNALGPRFQPRAQWCANLTTINTIGSMQTANGSLRFPEVANDRLLRKPLNEASELDSAGDSAGAGNDLVMVYGDYSQYLIADRIGSQMEIVQNLFDQATGRPTAQRGGLLWMRTGGGVLVDNAFRMLTA